MKKFLAVLAVYAPSIAFAQNLTNVNTAVSGFQGTVQSLTNAVNAVVPFLVAIAGVIFIYGVIRYVIATGPEEKTNARGYIIWGIVGLAVILAVWGLAKLLVNMFGLGGTDVTSADLPGVANTNPTP